MELRGAWWAIGRQGAFYLQESAGHCQSKLDYFEITKNLILAPLISLDIFSLGNAG